MIHAIRKNKLPNIAQKLPKLEIVKPIAETINKIQPNKFIFLFFIFFLKDIRAIYVEKLKTPIQ